MLQYRYASYSVTSYSVQPYTVLYLPVPAVARILLL